MAVELLEDFVWYGLKWEKDGSRHYVSGAVMHLARLNARTGCAVTTKDTKVRRRQKQTLFSTVYGRNQRLAVAGVLKATWKAVKGAHVADFHGLEDEERRTVCVNSERVTAVALCVPPAEQL